jgi:hypothetical protein
VIFAYSCFATATGEVTQDALIIGTKRVTWLKIVSDAWDTLFMMDLCSDS